MASSPSPAAKLRCPSHVYCGGAAWGCAYFIGCYDALLHTFGRDELSKVVFLGDSAGALLALGMALGRSPTDLDDLYVGLSV